MYRMILIGIDNQSYYYSVKTKEGNRWAKIRQYTGNVGEDIKKMLDVKIDSLKLQGNLLLARANNDLFIIDNYLKISHDIVFRKFNKKVIKMATNSDVIDKRLALQKKNDFKQASISTKTLFSAAMAGILLINITLTATDSPINNKKEIYNSMMAAEVSNTETVTPSPTPYLESADYQRELVIAQIKAYDAIKKQEEDQLKGLVEEYSSMFSVDFDRAWALVKEQEEDIKNNYASQELGILTIISKEYYSDKGIDKTPVKCDMPSMDREKLLLKYAKLNNITDTDIMATMLAIYRLETGYGSSYACINKNNYGGLRTQDKNGDYYLLSYKTPEIGAIAMVNTFISIMNKSINSSHYNPDLPLEYNMNRIYCGEPSWASDVKIIKIEVLADYDLNAFIKDDSGNAFTKK